MKKILMTSSQFFGWCVGRTLRLLTAPVATVLLMLLLFGANMSWAKGPLDNDVSDFSKNILSPILIREGLCNSRQNCREREFFFCVSWETIGCDVYGITDENLIKEIFMAMLNSGLKVHRFTFWRSTKREKSFFERPILEFSDHTGGK